MNYGSCTICVSDSSISQKNENDIKKHINSTGHQQNYLRVFRINKLNSFLEQPDNKSESGMFIHFLHFGTVSSFCGFRPCFRYFNKMLLDYGFRNHFKLWML